MKSDVLVHYHIFKNAGTSIDLALQKCFGIQWTTFEGTHSHDIKRHQDLFDFLLGNDAVRAVSTHLARPHKGAPKVQPIAFLRHPILRMRSVYEFTRADPKQPSREAARNQDFAGYVNWCFNEGRRSGGVVVRNYQVVHLSQASFRAGHILEAEALNSDLVEAQELITTWGFIGLVEEFASSCQVYQSMYNNIFPELDLQVFHENKTRGDLRETHIQIADIRDEIGQTLYERAMHENRLDLELYYWANKIFASKLGEYGFKTS